MRPVSSVVALAIASLFLAVDADAQDLSWHAGIGIGGKLDQRGPHDFDVDADNTQTLFVGARAENGFGAELAYVNLSNISSSGIADGGFALHGGLWSIGATYGVKLDAFEPYAKLGWFSRSEDGLSIGIAGPSPLHIDDDGVMAEVGVRFQVSEPFALRAGYVHYDFETGGDGNAQLSAEWHF